jgi:hypothetical protein
MVSENVKTCPLWCITVKFGPLIWVKDVALGYLRSRLKGQTEYDVIYWWRTFHNELHNLFIYGSTALVHLGRLFSFLMYTQNVGLLLRGISPSQGRYLHTDIHALSGIRTHNPSIRTGENSSCLRSRGHCDRTWFILFPKYQQDGKMNESIKCQ